MISPGKLEEPPVRLVHSKVSSIKPPRWLVNQSFFRVKFGIPKFCRPGPRFAHGWNPWGLRPAATRNAQRSVPNADPQRKGPMWISSSINGVDAFSPGRRKHPKEPYVLKGHVTSNHGTYCSTAWQGLGVNLWGRKKHLEGRLLLMEEILHHGG